VDAFVGSRAIQRFQVLADDNMPECHCRAASYDRNMAAQDPREKAAVDFQDSVDDLNAPTTHPRKGNA
jgi:hypothetical protein